MGLEWSLQIAAIGIGVVFATLISLQLVLTVPRWLVGLFAKPTVPSETVSEEDLDHIPPEHLAVISAVIAAMGRRQTLGIIRPVVGEKWQHNRYMQSGNRRF